MPNRMLRHLSVIALAAAMHTHPGLAGPDQPDASPMGGNGVANYCASILDAAAEARAAHVKHVLDSLRTEVETRIAMLETRNLELKTWVERQERLATAAEQVLVGIYSTMEPEIAAKQIMLLDRTTASSILRQMKPRDASTILNEMQPQAGAELMRIASEAMKRADRGSATQ